MSTQTPTRRLAGVDGEGAVWGAAGFAASLVVGATLEQFRSRIGLENVVIVFLAVVAVTAAVGGRAAGLVSALSAALSYNFFFTTPYRTLAVDSAEQLITVALLFVAGLLAALAGRSGRHAEAREQQEADTLLLLNQLAQAVAAGTDPDRLAVQGVLDLLDARQVQLRRGLVVTAEAGEHGDLNPTATVALDADGRIPPGHRRMRGLGFVLPGEGATFPLVRDGAQVGMLMIVPGVDRGLTRPMRAGLAAVAHLLALTGGPVPER